MQLGSLFHIEMRLYILDRLIIFSDTGDSIGVRFQSISTESLQRLHCAKVQRLTGHLIGPRPGNTYHSIHLYILVLYAYVCTYVCCIPKLSSPKARETWYSKLWRTPPSPSRGCQNVLSKTVFEDGEFGTFIALQRFMSFRTQNTVLLP